MTALAPTALIAVQIRGGDQTWRSSVAERYAARHERNADRFAAIADKMEVMGGADAPEGYLDAIGNFRQLAAVDREMAKMVRECRRTLEDEESWELTLRMEAVLDARKAA